LVELRKPIIIGSVDDDRICPGNVDAIFDYRRGDENIVFVIDEIEHYLLHFFLVHLPVADRDPRVRDDLLHKRGDRFYGLDAVMNKETCPFLDSSSSIADRITFSENWTT
jgi:hypothetical protein